MRRPVVINCVLCVAQKGDGYTAAEKDRFFDDMQRLVNDMFTSVTFASHLPLFNVWALFRASVDSGIGVGGKPKVKRLGLYLVAHLRPRTQHLVCIVTELN